MIDPAWILRALGWHRADAGRWVSPDGLEVGASEAGEYARRACAAWGFRRPVGPLAGDDE
jgi:hypothetical protein